MTLSSAINEGKVIHIMFGFIVFSAATFGVLMMMDTMECFLHSLRLHWYILILLGLNFKVNFTKEMVGHFRHFPSQFESILSIQFIKL